MNVSLILTFLVVYMSKEKLCQTTQTTGENEHTIEERIYGVVGVPFRHKLHRSSFNNADPYNERLHLLSEDGTQILSNTWLNLQRLTNEIYGFPLKGNHGMSTYYIKTSMENGSSKAYTLKLYIAKGTAEYLHEIKLCTGLSKKTLLNSLHIRYSLAQTLAHYLQGTEVANIKMADFRKHCFKFSFTNIDEGATCKFQAIQKLRNKLTRDGVISNEFKNILSNITSIESVNLTLKGDCDSVEQAKGKLLKSIAPILILAAIALISVGIACYVCQGVKRNRSLRMQQLKQKLQEEEIKKLHGIKQYQQTNRHDSCDSYTSELCSAKRPQQTILNDKKSQFVSKILHKYVPYSLQEKYQSAVKEKIQKKTWGLNPINRLLDISTNKQKKREKRGQLLYAAVSILNSHRQNNTDQSRKARLKKAVEFNISKSEILTKINNEKYGLPLQLTKEHKVLTFHEFKAKKTSAQTELKPNSIYRQILDNVTDKSKIDERTENKPHRKPDTLKLQRRGLNNSRSSQISTATSWSASSDQRRTLMDSVRSLADTGKDISQCIMENVNGSTISSHNAYNDHMPHPWSNETVRCSSAMERESISEPNTEYYSCPEYYYSDYELNIFPQEIQTHNQLHQKKANKLFHEQFMMEGYKLETSLQPVIEASTSHSTQLDNFSTRAETSFDGQLTLDPVCKGKLYPSLGSVSTVSFLPSKQNNQQTKNCYPIHRLYSSQFESNISIYPQHGLFVADKSLEGSSSTDATYFNCGSEYEVFQGEDNNSCMSNNISITVNPLECKSMQELNEYYEDIDKMTNKT